MHLLYDAVGRLNKALFARNFLAQSKALREAESSTSDLHCTLQRLFSLYLVIVQFRNGKNISVDNNNNNSGCYHNCCDVSSL